MYYHKLFKLVYEKITYKDTFLVSKNLLINIIFFICINYFDKSKNKSNSNGLKKIAF
jgi:hypothetical protein